jgi:hypothetical protein
MTTTMIDLTPDEKELMITALIIFETERNLGKEDYAKVQTIKRKLEGTIPSASESSGD